MKLLKYFVCFMVVFVTSGYSIEESEIERKKWKVVREQRPIQLPF
jgi:hypothetical protein